MNIETKQCQNCKNQFTIEPEDFNFYKKIDVPAPTWCPGCRRQRRLIFRNERVLYKGTCNLCSKSMLSIYSPDKPFTVYCKECWYSDKWDPLEYGQDYDWSKPFFVQFRDLLEKTPRIALMHIRTNTQSEYANYVADNKNIYLAYSVIESENVFYSRFVDKSKDCFDCFNIDGSEIAYENIDGDNNYSARYLFRSRDCLSSAFLFDCVNCQDCFMSSNLRNKRYVIRNVQHTKEDYIRTLEGTDFGSFDVTQKLCEEFAELTLRSHHKFGNLLKTINCSGDNIKNSKNVKNCFDVYDSENLKFCDRVVSLKDSYDIFGSGRGELQYEAVAAGLDSYGVRFSVTADASRDSRFVDFCMGSSHLFGCVSLRSKDYCILNKRYTKEEYESMIPRIVDHINKMPFIDKKGAVYKYGEFFPPEFSSFAYNESVAQEYFPLTKEKAEQQGYQWKDPERRNYQITMYPENLSDHIKDVDDAILKETIGCAHAVGSPSTGSGQIGKPICNEQCTTAFKIILPELQFYKKMNLPLPRLCPNCRHYRRLKQRSFLRLWRRQCMCNSREHFHGEKPCSNEFKTSYAPERPETIYCEQCYNAEVA